MLLPMREACAAIVREVRADAADRGKVRRFAAHWLSITRRGGEARRRQLAAARAVAADAARDARGIADAAPRGHVARQIACMHAARGAEIRGLFPRQARPPLEQLRLTAAVYLWRAHAARRRGGATTLRGAVLFNDTDAWATVVRAVAAPSLGDVLEAAMDNTQLRLAAAEVMRRWHAQGGWAALDRLLRDERQDLKRRVLMDMRGSMACWRRTGRIHERGGTLGTVWDFVAHRDNALLGVETQLLGVEPGDAAAIQLHDPMLRAALESAVRRAPDAFDSSGPFRATVRFELSAWQELCRRSKRLRKLSHRHAVWTTFGWYGVAPFQPAPEVERVEIVIEKNTAASRRRGRKKRARDRAQASLRAGGEGDDGGRWAIERIVDARRLWHRPGTPIVVVVKWAGHERQSAVMLSALTTDQKKVARRLAAEQKKPRVPSVLLKRARGGQGGGALKRKCGGRWVACGKRVREREVVDLGEERPTQRARVALAAEPGARLRKRVFVFCERGESEVRRPRRGVKPLACCDDDMTL